MKRLKILLCCLIPILAVAFLYFLGDIYFSNVFLPNSTLNGEDISYKTSQEVEDMLTEESQKSAITLIREDGGTEEIAFSDIGYNAEYAIDIDAIKEQQKIYSWPAAFFNERNYEVGINADYDEALLDSVIENLNCVTNETIQDPVDAHVEKTDTGFVVVESVDGNRLDLEKTKSIIMASLDSGKYEVDLQDQDCYKKATIMSDDKSITSLMELADKFNGLVLTMDMTDAEEVIDFSVFGDWLDVVDGEIVINDEKLNEYVSGLSVKYNTYGTTREFDATEIGTITVGGSDGDTFGFQLGIDETCQTIKDAILSGESQTIYPTWNIPGAARGVNDIGSTYIEVDLSRQHMWYYENGELTLETDVVSGLDTEARHTPTGAFRVWAKETDRYLEGQGYRSFVNFWMPFDWTGCGIHDASWRSSFGGDIYLYNGSHGCLNTPYDKVKELYDMVQIDTPVIIYQS